MDIDPETISGTEVDKWFVSRPPVIQFSINEAVEKEYISLKGQETRYTIQRRHIIAAMRMSARIEEANESNIVDETGAVDEEFTALLKSMHWFEKQSEAVRSTIDKAVNREYNGGSELYHSVHRRHIIAAMRSENTLDTEPETPTIEEIREWFAKHPRSGRFDIKDAVDKECAANKGQNKRSIIWQRHVDSAMRADTLHVEPKTPTVTEIGEWSTQQSDTEVGDWFAQQPESVRFNIDHLVDEECTNDKRKWRYIVQRKHIIAAMNASSQREAKPETRNKAASSILRDVIDPHIRIEGKCGSCDGTGESLTVHGWSKEGDPCYVCEGSGRVSKLVRVGDLASLLSLPK